MIKIHARYTHTAGTPREHGEGPASAGAVCGQGCSHALVSITKYINTYDHLHNVTSDKSPIGQWRHRVGISEQTDWLYARTR